MGQLQELDATIVAISPQLPEAIRTLAERHKLAFDILIDRGNEYAVRLGLRFTLPEDLREVYRSFGNDLAQRNGEPSWTLPMPARLVVDRQGILRNIDADADYRYRPEPEKTLADVKALG